MKFHYSEINIIPDLLTLIGSEWRVLTAEDISTIILLMHSGGLEVESAEELIAALGVLEELKLLEKRKLANKVTQFRTINYGK